MTLTAKLSTFLLIASSVLLVGSPGSGDRLDPDELTSVRQTGSDLCFLVSNAQDYQPTLITISARATPPQEWTLYENPNIAVTQGELCIPSSFYRFSDDRTYVVRYILQSKKNSDSRRSVVSAIAFTNGSVRNVPLRKDEAAYY
ncbi:putative T6SS immunity periplasmic lipoprotein [Pectobacterium aroidearum]|uniref:putative T6SS immunity periplasmic lipoprotein n=1 Tax=Pectobacterium aroidearum TaxID=1201031 RepID=UPI0032EF9100